MVLRRYFTTMEADPDGNQIIFQLLLLLFFTLMNAFFAGAEMAVVSVNKNRIRKLAEEGNKKAIIIQGLFEDSTKFLSTIQVAITFAGFYSSASAASGIAPILADWLGKLQIPYSSAIAHNGVTLLLMFFNLVFGELVPKRIALQKAEPFCMITVMPIHYISIVLSPFIRLLSVSTKAVLKVLHLKTEDEEETVTEEEILTMMEVGCEGGTIADHECKMVHSVFEFGNKSAREVMVPRQKVFAIDCNEPLESILDELLENRHSRIPVYEEEIDNIIGILYVKDIMLQLRKGSIEKETIETMMQKPFFVPEKKEAEQLFREMQKNRNHMAILVDEYGGFSGIVTIEDLVEEIMGEIHEEHEQVEPDIIPIADGEFLLNGSMLIADINEEFTLKIVSEYYDTISGYMIERLGYIPNEQAKEIIEEEGYQFRIEQVEGNRISRVRLLLK